MRKLFVTRICAAYSCRNASACEGNAPDWWGEIESVPTGATEDRYVAARRPPTVPTRRGGPQWLAGPRSRAQRGSLRSRCRAAAEGGLGGRLRFRPSAFERPRYEGSPGDRLQVPSKWLQAEVPPGARVPRQRDGHRHQADGSQSAAARLCGAAGAYAGRDVRAAPARARRPMCLEAIWA